MLNLVLKKIQQEPLQENSKADKIIRFLDIVEHMFYNICGDINMNKYIMHIDVNNAFLSWTAVEMLKNGFDTDIRTIASIIGGDEKQRHGIVLAKSNIAKQFGIKTAETIYQAKKNVLN